MARGSLLVRVFAPVGMLIGSSRISWKGHGVCFLINGAGPCVKRVKVVLKISLSALGF
jgi:hypothetical protein